jgi:protein-S-isoprenylcysteine O-methyltransferase Ste14
MKPLMIHIGNFFFTWRNKTFPLIILALFVLAVPPTELFGSESMELVKDAFALMVTLSGLAVRACVIGYAYIKRGGLNKKVYAENLVTEGMFSLCRNPLYLGNVLIYAGVFLMHGNGLVMLLGMGSYLFIYQCIIYAEEAYLANKFGDAYAAYCRDVPRWIPRLSQFSAATEGMAFNIKRVIVKDYTTMAVAFITLALTEGYEYLAGYGIETHQTYLAFLLSVIVLSGLWIASIQFYKKKIVKPS